MTDPIHPLDELRRRAVTASYTSKAKGDALEDHAAQIMHLALGATGYVRTDTGHDEGVDGICFLPDGRKVAVQVKCLAPDTGVDLADLTKFTAKAEAEGCELFVLITTSYVTTRARKHALRKGIVTLGYDELTAMPLDFRSPVAPSAPLPAPAPLALEPHQREALAAITSADRNGRCTMATGTGKTLVEIAWALSRPGITVFAAPSLELIGQHAASIRRQAPNARILGVSSDVEVREVPGVPIEFTTDPGYAAEWLTAHAPDALLSPTVVLVTYRSGPTVVEAVRRSGVRIASLVADEAHRTASVNARGVIAPARSNALVLDLPRDQARFFTATERRHGKQLKDAFALESVLSCSMDNESLYGPRLFSLTYTEALRRGLVLPFVFAIGVVTDKSMRDLLAERAWVNPPEFDPDDAEHIEDLASVAHLFDCAAKYGITSVLTVHNSVQSARRAKRLIDQFALFVGRDDVTSAVVVAQNYTDEEDGTVVRSSEARRRGREILAQRTGLNIVCQVRVFGEGVDVPELDAVCYFDSRSSAIDVVQMVGRSTRIDRSRRSVSATAYVVLPLFVGTAIDAEQAIEQSRFDKLYAVLTALQDGDIVISQVVDSGGTPPKAVPGDGGAKIVVSHTWAAGFDARLLRTGIESLAVRNKWYRYREILADFAALHHSDFVTVVNEMRLDYKAAGLTSDEAKERTVQAVRDIIAEAGGDPDRVLTAMTGSRSRSTV